MDIPIKPRLSMWRFTDSAPATGISSASAEELPCELSQGYQGSSVYVGLTGLGFVVSLMLSLIRVWEFGLSYDDWG